MRVYGRLLASLVLVLLAAGCTVPVTIEWVTEVEMDTAGFDLYRGESPDGPFDVKVNDELIPPAPDPMAGGEYRYVDRTARAGKTYYYQLQEVEIEGAINTYGPIEITASWLDSRRVLALAALVVVLGLMWLFLPRRRPRETG